MEAAKILSELGYNLAGTPGTAEYYSSMGLKIVSVQKPLPDVEVENDAVTWIRSKKIDLVINIPEGTTRSDEVSAGYLIRRAAVDFGASLLTNIK